MRRVDKESEHQEGTCKERKREESQNMEQKKRKTKKKRMRSIKLEIRTGCLFLQQEISKIRIKKEKNLL